MTETIASHRYLIATFIISSYPTINKEQKKRRKKKKKKKEGKKRKVAKKKRKKKKEKKKKKKKRFFPSNPPQNIINEKELCKKRLLRELLSETGYSMVYFAD